MKNSTTLNNYLLGLSDRRSATRFRVSANAVRITTTKYELFNYYNNKIINICKQNKKQKTSVADTYKCKAIEHSTKSVS